MTEFPIQISRIPLPLFPERQAGSCSTYYALLPGGASPAAGGAFGNNGWAIEVSSSEATIF